MLPHKPGGDGDDAVPCPDGAVHYARIEVEFRLAADVTDVFQVTVLAYSQLIMKDTCEILGGRQSFGGRRCVEQTVVFVVHHHVAVDVEHPVDVGIEQGAYPEARERDGWQVAVPVESREFGKFGEIRREYPDLGSGDCVLELTHPCVIGPDDEEADRNR